MLVSDVGDSLYWRQVWDVNDRLQIFFIKSYGIDTSCRWPIFDIIKSTTWSPPIWRHPYGPYDMVLTSRDQWERSRPAFPMDKKCQKIHGKARHGRITGKLPGTASFRHSRWISVMFSEQEGLSGRFPSISDRKHQRNKCKFSSIDILLRCRKNPSVW